MTAFNVPVLFNAPIPFNGEDLIVPDTAFPGNIVTCLQPFLAGLEGVDNVIGRVVRPTDPNGTVGIAVSSWIPTTQEIGVGEPMGSYSVFVSTVQRYTSEVEGRRNSSLLVKSIRVLLYRNRDLHVALHQLTETISGLTESVSRARVKQQRFIDDKMQNAFLFLSVTQLDVDTDIV